MPVHIHHVQVAIPPDNEDRAREFYGVLLGLAEVAKPANLQGRGGVWFDTGKPPGAFRR
jgi:catechol 2,3-dioxygenase-like lactoylglutathione lyase family enzyme